MGAIVPGGGRPAFAVGGGGGGACMTTVLCLVMGSASSTGGSMTGRVLLASTKILGGCGRGGETSGGYVWS